MAKEYKRKDDGTVDYLTLHQNMTDPEFEDRKVHYENQIGALSDQISALKHAEVPPDATPEQETAVADFNVSVDQEMDAIKQQRKQLLAERASMEGV